MNPYDSVDKRLSALAEWLKSNATNTQETANADHKLYQNHASYFHHPYMNFSGQFADNNGFANHTNKPQRERTTFKENHLQILERCFNEVKHPDTRRREKLAKELGFPVKTIQIWFQNKRARERKGGKEKKASDGCIENKQSISGMESEYSLNGESGSTDSIGTEKSETSSTTKTDSLESCTTTVVEELESSKQQEKSSNPETIEDHGNINEEFTIIHIPEIQSCPNTHQINPTCMEIDTANLTYQTNVQELAQETSVEPTIEEQFARSVENLDIDLIVKTYEAIQSSENVDILIENWLADCSQDKEDGGEKLTLEENLKHFIQFSQKTANNKYN